MKRIALAALFLTPLSLSACGGGDNSDGDKPAAKPETFTASGTVTLDMSETTHWNKVPVGSPCSGEGGYADISGGAQVTVTDSAGKMVGVGTLDGGRWVKAPTYDEQGELYNYNCEFSFTVSDVPESGNIYGIEVGHRSAPNFTRAEATAIALTIDAN